MENNIEPYGNRNSQKAWEKEEAYLRAQKKVKAIMGFYWHLASYVIVNIFLIILITSNGVKFFSFGTFSTAFFWGIGIFFHFLGVFGSDFFLGKQWEQKKIKEIMDKDTKYWE
ncbi:2TM domain-containing protein [Psychroserpens damuponensis]|uniref:2TM domain-containing protein n=1 Tax=Psychroserpens damuponensis TaxID=943936 RepID=UPI0005917F4F|nr:2TM domain-containing protein [Psychroserpens damuponensis]